MNRNVDVMEEKLDLVMNLDYYFYLNSENVAEQIQSLCNFPSFKFVKIQPANKVQSLILKMACLQCP